MNLLEKALETNATQIKDLDFAIKQTEKDLRKMRKTYKELLKETFYMWQFNKNQLKNLEFLKDLYNRL